MRLIHFPRLHTQTLCSARPPSSCLSSPRPLPSSAFAPNSTNAATTAWRVWSDLFGRASSPATGRLGTQGRIHRDPHPDPGAAINALAAVARQKRRRGYQDRAG